METPTNSTSKAKPPALPPHPESLLGSIDPITRFTFSFGELERSKTEVELEYEAVHRRIDGIINACKVSGQHPVIEWILNITHDPGELKRLSKGLERVSEIIEHHDKLEARMSVLEAAEKDPEWFAWAFAETGTMFDPSTLPTDWEKDQK